MIDRLQSNEIRAKREAYLKMLFENALSGDAEAGATLSRIALGGASERARELTSQMDEAFSRNKSRPAEKLEVI